MARTMRRNKRAFRTASGPESPELLPRSSGLLNCRVASTVLPGLEGMFGFEEHHMDTRWFECDRFARIELIPAARTSDAEFHQFLEKLRVVHREPRFDIAPELRRARLSA